MSIKFFSFILNIQYIYCTHKIFININILQYVFIIIYEYLFNNPIFRKFIFNFIFSREDIKFRFFSELWNFKNFWVVAPFLYDLLFFFLFTFQCDIDEYFTFFLINQNFFSHFFYSIYPKISKLSSLKKNGYCWRKFSENIWRRK